MYTFRQTRSQACIHVYLVTPMIQTPMYIFRHTNLCAHKFRFASTYMCVYTNMIPFIHAYAHTYTCLYIHISIQYVCTLAQTDIQYPYMHTYIQLSIHTTKAFIHTYTLAYDVHSFSHISKVAEEVLHKKTIMEEKNKFHYLIRISGPDPSDGTLTPS